MFELVTSEASYYKSLEILETHFLRNPVLFNTLSQSDMHFLFSNIEDVMKASERWRAVVHGIASFPEHEFRLPAVVPPPIFTGFSWI